MKNIKILWTDDEIDLLKPHIIFLEQKGYEVQTTTNGIDAIELVEKEYFDIIFLDENMPGLSGIETLSRIKTISPNIPIIMITKSEEESIMDEAIGSKINDYLIKPVNPNQILLAIKKNLDKQRLVTQKTTSAYQSEFSKLGMEINDSFDYNDWYEIYKKLVYWELELADSEDNAMDEVLKMQQNEANSNFAKFIKKNYVSWFDTKNEKKPLLSPNLLKEKVFPLLKNNEKVLFLLIDNLRFDQWKVLEPLLLPYYQVQEEDLFFSILPTATQYSRNSIFSGLMPSEINNLYPHLWRNDEEEGEKNQYEEEMLRSQLNRYGIKSNLHFEKILDPKYTKKILDNFNSIINNQFVVIIINFIDSLSHARTDQKMIRELADTTLAYRALTKSWFEHSSLFEMLKIFAEQDITLVISTDHGSINVMNPIKIIGDKNTTTNLRYKQGKSLNYNKKDVFDIINPLEAYLPKTNITSTYVFSTKNDFFAYPNNYNHYVKYYKDTFQHGGVSLQEMIIPAITLKPKK